MKKRGVANVVAYVLLVALAVAVSGLVYSGLRESVPDFDVISCPDATQISLRDVQCSQKNYCVTLLNNGKFTAEGYVLRADNRSPKSYDLYTLDENGSRILPSTELKLSEEFPIDYSRDEESGEFFSNLTYLEVQPYVYDEEGNRLLCEEIISQEVYCLPNYRDCLGECRDKDCIPPTNCQEAKCGPEGCEFSDKCKVGLQCVLDEGGNFLGCEKKVDLIFLLDNSGSVNAADFNNLKLSVRNVLDYLRISLENDATQISFITYNSTIDKVVGLTNDYDLLVNSLESIVDYPSETDTNTHLQGALLNAYNEFNNSDREGFENYVVIIGDSVVNNIYVELYGGEPIRYLQTAELINNLPISLDEKVSSLGAFTPTIKKTLTVEIADRLKEDHDVTILSMFVGDDRYLTYTDISDPNVNILRFLKGKDSPVNDPSSNNYYFNVTSYSSLVNSLEDVIPVVKNQTDN